MHHKPSNASAINILRKFTYKGYSMLDTFICRMPRKRRTKKIMAFGNADLEEQPMFASTEIEIFYEYFDQDVYKAFSGPFIFTMDIYVPVCLKSNGLKVIEFHRTTTKKYHFLCDGITQQTETDGFYDLQLTKGPSTSSIFSLTYRRSTKARANSIAVSGPRLVTAFRFTRYHICSELFHE